MTGWTTALWPDPRLGPWHLHLGWKRLDGREECVEVHIHSQAFDAEHPLHGNYLERMYPLPAAAEGRPVSSTMFRALGIATIVAEERARQAAAFREEFLGRRQPSTDQGRAQVAGDIEAWSSWRPGRPGRPPRHGPDHYQRIATDYSAAAAAGLPDPVKALAERHDVPLSTARKWVWRARRDGLLPATTRGFVKGADTE